MKQAEKRYKVKESQYHLDKETGRSKTWVRIEELGWCEYSWAHDAIKINGEWFSDWEDHSPGK